MVIATYAAHICPEENLTASGKLSKIRGCQK
jgi:hypothetical protein